MLLGTFGAIITVVAVTAEVTCGRGPVPGPDQYGPGADPYGRGPVHARTRTGADPYWRGPVRRRARRKATAAGTAATVGTATAVTVAAEAAAVVTVAAGAVTETVVVVTTAAPPHGAVCLPGGRLAQPYQGPGPGRTPPPSTPCPLLTLQACARLPCFYVWAAEFLWLHVWPFSHIYWLLNFCGCMFGHFGIFIVTARLISQVYCRIFIFAYLFFAAFSRCAFGAEYLALFALQVDGARAR